MRKAIVAGGSIGGLFVATALIKAGWSVCLFERSKVELSGRGAGIVTHEPLIEAFRAVGASTDELGVTVAERIAIDIAGDVVSRLDYPQVVTSWDRIHQILRVLVPDEAYRLGRAVVGYEQTIKKVVAVLEDGSREEADLLVGADGFRSAVRQQMLPDIQPDFAGYVVWRALADEASMTPDVHARLFEHFVFFAPNQTQIVGYPIAGLENDLRAGHRRYNFVWYSRVSDADLRDMMTDGSGHYHPVSIPPPLIRDDVLENMETDAASRLPTPFVDIIRRSARPFFTPIYDHCSPTFGQGRVALLGDAACVARPHVGMGVTKAAHDALALVRLVSEQSVEDALQAYSTERVAASRLAYEQAKKLGGYIFETDQTQNLDGRSHNHLQEIMRDTAIPVM